MENNFKDILPNGLESYDNLEDKINEDGSFQLKVNSFTKTKILFCCGGEFEAF